jgi:hypothetical protein
MAPLSWMDECIGTFPKKGRRDDAHELTTITTPAPRPRPGTFVSFTGPERYPYQSSCQLPARRRARGRRPRPARELSRLVAALPRSEIRRATVTASKRLARDERPNRSQSR